MKVSLVVQTPGKQEGKALSIPLAQFVIGRDPQCHLRPASPSISKRHCALIQRDGKLFIRDFDSTNGTFVNDQQVKGEVELKNGDNLRVGPLLFSVKIEGTPAVNRPTPAPPTKTPAPAKSPVPAKPASQGTQPPKAASPATAPQPQPAGPKVAAPKLAATPQQTPPAKAVARQSDSQETTAGEGTGDDDSVAAMLLSLQEESNSEPPGLGANDVPEGSTVMDLNVMAQLQTSQQANGEEKPPEEPKKKEEEKPKPAPQSTTASAAKALLEKYMRRPR